MKRSGQSRRAKARVVEPGNGDVDRLSVRVLRSEIRLLVFASERQPLVQARLTPDEARELAQLLGDAAVQLSELLR